MSLKHRNSGKGKLLKAVSQVLMVLAEAPREPTGEAWMTGERLQEATKFSSTEINDAVKILEEQGYVDLQETYGTAPFDFATVSLNARGRLELERREPKAVPKSEHVNGNSKEWDLFICHASEDKEEIVRPLVEALVEKGFAVWYDEFTLTLGDSLRRSIDKGLAQSKYGLVVLSPNFFKKNWPQTELDGLAAKEVNGRKVILPVWHKVDREYVLKFSPTLADRVAVSTENGIDKVVEEVLRAVKPSKAEQKVTAKKTEEESAIGRLDHVTSFLGGKSSESITKTVKETEFHNLKKMFLDVLDAIAFFDLRESQSNLGVFNFIQLAILERNRKEGAELFKELLAWFFETVTPSCKEVVLEIFARLTRLSYLKQVVKRTNFVSSFVAEFGSSKSYGIAGINAEILKNIQSLLSETDCRRIVDFALSNDQILGSWRAKDSLWKIVNSCEAKVDRERIEELIGLLT